MKKNILFLLAFLNGWPLFAQMPELKINSGHSDEVTSVCFSPDDRYIASGSIDKTIKLWDVATGKELKTFIDTSEIKSVVFSKDGKYIISGGQDGLNMWEIETGKVVNMTRNCYPHFINISEDGRFIVYDNIITDNTIDLFDIQAGKVIRSYTGHKDYVQSAAFSADGRYIVSGSSDKTIKLWDVKTGFVLKTFIGHKDEVTSVSFSPDGRFIVSGGGNNDRTVRVWNISSKSLVLTLTGHTNAVETVCFSPDSKYVVSGSADGTVKFWDLATGENVKTYPRSFVEFVTAIKFSHDGKYLVCGKTDKIIGLWDVATDKEILLPGDKLEIPRVFFSPDGKSVLNTNDDLGKKNISVKRWSWNEAEKVTIVEGVKEIMQKVNKVDDGYFTIPGYSNDYKNVICYSSANNASTVDIVDLKTSQRIKTFEVEAGIDMTAISPDGKYLVIGTYKSIQLYNVETGTKIKSFQGYINWIESINFSPDGRFIVSGGNDSIGNVVKVWAVPSGREVMRMEGHVNAIKSVCFSSDGKYIVSSSCDGNIKIWSATSGQELRNLTGEKPSMISSVTFSPDGKYLVSGHFNEEYAVKLWDFSTGVLINTFLGHVGGVKSVNFSPDGKCIVSASEDGSVKIWDIATGVCMVTRYDVPNSDDWVAVTPDGRFDGTDGGMKLLYYVKDMEVIPLESFYEKFYTPNLVAQVMSGNREANFNPYAMGNDIKLPPKVKIVSPTTNDRFQTEEVEVVVEASDQGGGVDEIRLYQNGKLVSEEQRGMKLVSQVGEKVTKRYKISLLSGNNEFKATAFNRDRTEAIPYSVNIELSKVITSSNLYLVSIGINRYKNEKYTLTYSCSDAQGFAQAIATKSKGIFKDIKTLILKDEQCTKEGILSNLDELSKVVKPEDVFIFYYAGHGVMSEGSEDAPSEFYFVPYDVTQLYGNDELLKLKGISASELRKALVSIKAQKQLIVMDACQSGGATEMLAMRGAAEEKALMQLARSAGIAVLASTGTEQFASEVKQLGHGVFTYSLIDGLSGKADGGEKDGKITIKELAAFLEDNVPELTKKYRGSAQYPNTSIRGMDFPIVVWK